jgi:hypothetical protein
MSKRTIRLEEIRVKDLYDFAREYSTAKKPEDVEVISQHRALSQANNPHEGKDKTLLFADRNMAKVQWYVKREVNTPSCGAENALRSPPFGPSAGSGITSGSR